MVVGAGLPVDPRQAHDVVERRRGKRPADDARGRVAGANLDRAVLVAVLHRPEAEQVAFPQRPADRPGDLLAIERRRIQAAVGRDRRGLHGVVSEEHRRGAVQRVAARAGDDVDGRAGRASKVRGKPAGGDLELLHALLDDVEQRPAHHVVVVVHAVDGDVAAAAELPGRRDDDGVGLGGIEVRRRRVAGHQQRQLHEVAAVERQPVDGRARNHGVHHGSRGVHEPGAGGVDHDVFPHAGHGERRVKVQDLSDPQRHGFEAVRRKAGGGDRRRQSRWAEGRAAGTARWYRWSPRATIRWPTRSPRPSRPGRAGTAGPAPGRAMSRLTRFGPRPRRDRDTRPRAPPPSIALTCR